LRPLTHFLFSAVLVGSSGCASAPSQPALSRAQMEAAYEDAARDRASFELSCPKEQIGTTPIGQSANAGLMTVDRVVGVTGCGRKVVYVARCTWSSPDGVIVTGKSCVAFLDSDEHSRLVAPSADAGP
jgi:hypothetical protein